jgi:hypothetical protein
LRVLQCLTKAGKTQKLFVGGVATPVFCCPLSTPAHILAFQT